MTSRITGDITTAAAVTTAAILPVSAPAVGVYGGATGEQGVEVLDGIGGLAGVSPVLAGAYLGYLVVRMLVPAVLIVVIIRCVPAKQRSELLRTYLSGTAERPPQQAIAHPLSATDNPAPRGGGVGG